MRISYYGHSCARLSKSGLPGVIMDGYPTALGKRGSGKNMRAEIATFSAGQPKEPPPFPGLRLVLDAPGEYEIGGLFIHGLALAPAEREAGQYEERSGFLFHDAGVSILHLGALAGPLPPDLLPYDEPLTALLLPLGNGLNGEAAAALTNELQPLFVAPMFGELPAGGWEAALALNEFAAALGVSKPDPQPSLNLNANTLDAEAGSQLVCLNPA